MHNKGDYASRLMCDNFNICIFLCLGLKYNKWKIQLGFKQVLPSSPCLFIFPFSCSLTKEF